MKERNSNIELLRILLAMGVIVLHYNNPDMGGGLLYSRGINYYLLVFLESMAICAVNVFLIISGYYLCKTSNPSPGKAVRLLVQVIVMNLAVYGISLCLQLRGGTAPGGWSVFKGLCLAILPNNYYVILYIGVYLVSRYINIIFETLASKKGLGEMMLLLILLFSLEPTVTDVISLVTGDSLAGLSMISITGSQSGYNMINFLLMYCVGAYIRYSHLEQTWSLGKSLIGYLVCVLLNLVLYLPQSLWNVDTTGIAWAYSSPFVIGESVFLFLIFLRLPMGCVKPVNQLSRASFTVYLCHTWFLPYLGIERFVGGNAGLLLGHLVVSVVAVYCLCWVIYRVYSVLENVAVSVINS